MEPSAPPAASADHITRNEAFWDGSAEVYQVLHAEQLRTDEPVWSVFGIPERELGVLGDVRGKDVVDLGCGAAQFSIALARQGARVTGVDLSAEQLRIAGELIAEHGGEDQLDLTLVHDDVEECSLPSASFDIAFSDYGASMFADPLRWVPEAARLLRPGGRLAFSAFTPIVELCWPRDPREVTSNKLNRDYFDLHRVEDNAVMFNLPYGEWVRLFRRSGLEIVDLVETRPAPGITSTAYRSENQVAWARRWPAEMIWVLDRRAD